MDSSEQKSNDVENAQVTFTRVLQPPGGASSNIFGNDSAEIEQQNSTAVKNRQQSSLFSSDLPAPSSASRTGRTDETPQGLPGAPEVGAPKPAASKGTDNSSETSVKKTSDSRKGFNPITGQAYDESSSTQRQTAKDGSVPSQSNATRTRQPPGGVSSKLW